MPPKPSSSSPSSSNPSHDSRLTYDTTLPVHERFATWQGEGVHVGKRAFFIRLYGCPLRCPWCDSAGTWHPKHRPSNMAKLRMKLGVLVNEVLRSKAERVVITGGEPAVHDLTMLTQILKRASIGVHLETSGAFPLRGVFDWVTVSPKWAGPPLPENVKRADEIKLIVENTHSIPDWMAHPCMKHKRLGVPIWLHPEWSRRNDASILHEISSWTKAHGDPFRAGFQLHKLYRVDMMDERAAEPVPLGGDPAKGF